MENLARPKHPAHDLALIERMLSKLHTLVREEIGEERAPFDLNMFGAREIKYKKEKRATTNDRRIQRIKGEVGSRIVLFTAEKPN